MEFDLTAFMLAPSIEVFDRCRKDDLLQIAQFFKIAVSRHSTKKDIKTVLQRKLVEDQILPELTIASDAEEEELALGLEKKPPQVVQPSPLRLSPDIPVAVRLKELELEVKRQEHQNKLLRLRELEMEMEMKRRDFDIREPPQSPGLTSFVSLPATVGAPVTSTPAAPVGETSAFPVFDVGKHVKLVPPFREVEVDSYFVAFERVAGALLFSREKQTLFDKWCTTCKVATFQQLRELMLLEDFKGCLSDNLVVHLNEQKVSSLAEAAVLVDELVLSHKVVFPHAVRHEKVADAAVQGKYVADAVKAVRGGKQGGYRPPSVRTTQRVCFYCLDTGHLIADCEAWKKK